MVRMVGVRTIKALSFLLGITVLFWCGSAFAAPNSDTYTTQESSSSYQMNVVYQRRDSSNVYEDPYFDFPVNIDIAQPDPTEKELNDNIREFEGYVFVGYSVVPHDFDNPTGMALVTYYYIAQDSPYIEEEREFVAIEHREYQNRTYGQPQSITFPDDDEGTVSEVSQDTEMILNSADTNEGSETALIDTDITSSDQALQETSLTSDPQSEEQGANKILLSAVLVATVSLVTLLIPLRFRKSDEKQQGLE